MKICHKCGSGNSDSAVICIECSASLTETAVQQAEEIVKVKLRHTGVEPAWF
ncbi:MAG: hypothetical protein IJ460_06025 [Clostridia bacterium]|nr:hypothetical protein [Clostridia bacterium]